MLSLRLVPGTALGDSGLLLSGVRHEKAEVSRKVIVPVVVWIQCPLKSSRAEGGAGEGKSVTAVHLWRLCLVRMTPSLCSLLPPLPQAQDSTIGLCLAVVSG